MSIAVMVVVWVVLRVTVLLILFLSFGSNVVVLKETDEVYGGVPGKDVVTLSPLLSQPQSGLRPQSGSPLSLIRSVRPYTKPHPVPPNRVNALEPCRFTMLVFLTMKLEGCLAWAHRPFEAAGCIPQRLECPKTEKFPSRIQCNMAGICKAFAE